MKANLFVVATLSIVLSGCSFLFGGPSATVKKFMAAAQKNDSETMTQLFSNKAIERIGPDKVKSNNQQFAEMVHRTYELDNSYSLDQLVEKRSGDTSRVSFFYHNAKRSDSIKLVVDLIKENGAWKIDDIGGHEKEDAESATTPSPAGVTLGTPSPSRSMEVPPPPPPPSSQPTPHTSGSRPPISGGILNGKATSLPKPAYSPAARAVKAAGVVMVQITVDEKGNVTSASAVSGHPLLRAAAVSAAYGAKFSPTLLSGQPVKVNGLLRYTFVAE